MDVSVILDQLDTQLRAVDTAKSAVEVKQAACAKVRASFDDAMAKANGDLAEASTAHQQAVDAANQIRATLNESLAESLGPLDTGRVR